jgi:hypothetical protein
MLVRLGMLVVVVATTASGCCCGGSSPATISACLLAYVADADTQEPVPDFSLTASCDGRDPPIEIGGSVHYAAVWDDVGGSCTVTVSAPGYEPQTQTARCPDEDMCGRPESHVLHFNLVRILGYVPDAGSDDGPPDAASDDGPADAGAD